MFANGPGSCAARSVRRSLELRKLSTADTGAIRQLRDHRREPREPSVQAELGAYSQA